MPGGVVAQTWRGGGRQARLARLQHAPAAEIVPLDDVAARVVGILCGRTGAADIVDASVVVCARERGHRVVSSDAGDLLALDPTLSVVAP